MYLLNVCDSPRITGTEPWTYAVAGESLVPVLTSIVSNGKWQSTVQIQLLIAAHDKYTLCKVEMYAYQ